METRLSGHDVYRTEYHVIWIPKYCRRILNPGVMEDISKLFPKVLRGMPGCEILEQNIQLDHIHLLMEIPPKYAVSEVIGQMKQYMAIRLREKFVWLEKLFNTIRRHQSLGYMTPQRFLERLGEHKRKGGHVSLMYWTRTSSIKIGLITVILDVRYCPICTDRVQSVDRRYGFCYSLGWLLARTKM